HGTRQNGKSGTHAETHAAHGHSPYKLTPNTHAETHAAHGFRVSAGQKLTRNSRGLLTHPLSLKREEGVRPPANATGPPTTPAATPPPEATPTPPPNPRSHLMLGHIPLADVLDMLTPDDHDTPDGCLYVRDVLPHQRTSEHYPQIGRAHVGTPV